MLGQAACSRRKSADPNANASAAGTNLSEGDRSRARVYVDQGKELYRDDQDEKALEAFQQAILIDPDLAEAHFRLGLTFDALGQKQEAEAAYKKAIEKYKKHLQENSDDAEAHYNLGQTYAGLSLYNEAVSEYRQATRRRRRCDIFTLGEALTSSPDMTKRLRLFEVDGDRSENYGRDALAETGRRNVFARARRIRRICLKEEEEKS